MRRLNDCEYYFVVLYIIMLATILGVIVLLPSSIDSTDPAAYPIIAGAILTCIIGMIKYRPYLMDFKYDRGGITVVKPSLIFPPLKVKYFIRFDEMKYLFVETVLVLALKKPDIFYVVEVNEAVTIVDYRDKKHTFARNNEFRKNGINYMKGFREFLAEFYDRCEENVPVFVGYNIFSDPMITPEGEIRRRFTLKIRVDPDFYFHVVKTRVRNKDGSPINPDDFKIPDDIPHIDLKKDEKPEEKLREMKLREAWRMT